MISGIHLIVYSKNAEADKAFFRDVLQLSHVDVGRGWIIFGLPPAEIAAHPAEDNGRQEIYLMCDNIKVFVKQMARHKIVCSEIQDQGWGQLVQLTLPGGGQLGVYQPRHARPKPMKIKAQKKSAKIKRPSNQKKGKK